MITWWEETDRGISVDLIIEKKRGFTSRLLEFAYTQNQTLFPVLLDGPYGTPSTLHDYGTVLLFADDIGIAAVLPYAKQILRLSQENRCVTKKVILIWRYTSRGQ
jgi:NAD(P)H-flavin reductase